MKDSFGVDVEVGDYVLSAAMSTGRAKLGVVYRASGGSLMMAATADGTGWHGEQSRAALGYMVAVLRKADGTVPAHVTGVSP